MKVITISFLFFYLTSFNNIEKRSEGIRLPHKIDSLLRVNNLKYKVDFGLVQSYSDTLSFRIFMRNKDSAQNPNIPSAKHIYAHVQLSDNHIFTIYFENGYPIKTKIKGGFALKFAPSDSDYGFSCIKNGDSLDLISYRNSSNGDSWFKR